METGSGFTLRLDLFGSKNIERKSERIHCKAAILSGFSYGYGQFHTLGQNSSKV